MQLAIVYHLADCLIRYLMGLVLGGCFDNRDKRPIIGRKRIQLLHLEAVSRSLELSDYTGCERENSRGA